MEQCFLHNGDQRTAGASQRFVAIGGLYDAFDPTFGTICTPMAGREKEIVMGLT